MKKNNINQNTPTAMYKNITFSPNRTIILACFLLSFAFATAQIPTNGLVAYYAFNGNANDESGNNNTGTVNGATLTTDRFGNAGKAYSFDGVNDYIEILDALPLRLANTDFTISTWFIYSSSTNNNSLISKRSDQFQNGWCFGINGGLVPNDSAGFLTYIESGGNDPKISTQSALHINDWQHIVIQYTLATQTIKIFYNGILENTKYNFPTPNANTNINLLIGNNNLQPYFFLGKIDDIRIYNRALTPTEITALYNEGGWSSLNQGLVAHYPFNGNANDSSGNGNNGTVNGATLTSDRFGNVGKAYSFDGVNDYINASLNTKNYGISLWFYAESFSNQFNNLYDYENTYTEITNDSTVYSRAQQSFPPSIHVLTNKKNSLLYWHHLVVNYNSVVKTMDVNIDNIYHFSSTTISDGIYWPADTNKIIYFGGYFLHSINYFNGKLDDIRIYNRALTPTEITALYQEGMPTPPTTQSSSRCGAGAITLTASGATIGDTYEWYASPISPTVLGTAANYTIANLAQTDTFYVALESAGVLSARVPAIAFVFQAGTTVTDTINKFIHDGRDCQNYQIVKIGNQWWMQENLNATKYANGTIIPNVANNAVWSNLSTGALGYYDNDSTQYAQTYGAMYNWYAVNDSRGLCPNGWHGPSHSEWNKLEKYIDNTVDTTGISNAFVGTDIGIKLKEVGTAHWSSGNNGTNSSGFSALPGGFRNNDGQYSSIGNAGFWCLATAYDASSAWKRFLVYNLAGVVRNNSWKAAGQSVRCVKSSCSDILASHTITICSGQSYTVGTHTYTTDGIYTDTIPMPGGCDSIITTHLTTYAVADIGDGVNGTPMNAFLPTTPICTSFPTTVTIYPAQAGVHYQLLVNGTLFGSEYVGSNDSIVLPTPVLTGNTTIQIKGTISLVPCEKILNISLQVNPVAPQYHYTNLSICYGDSALLYGTWHNQSGTYTDNGSCDSINATNLTVVHVSNLNEGTGSSSLPNSLSQGLVAYYPFNGNADDESGNNNNGSVNGATLTIDRFGNAGKAYSFDGVNNSITASIGTHQQIAFSFWYYCDNILNENSNFVGYHNSYITLTTYPGQRIYARMQKPSDPSYDINPNILPSLSNWHHVVVYFNYTDNIIKLKIDNGTEYSSSTSTAGGYDALLDNGIVTIGSHQNPLINCFYNGKLDDIRIYNRAITPTEIAALYNEGQPLSVSLSSDTIPQGSGTQLNISNAQAGVNYQYSVNAGQYSAGLVGNGTSLIVNLQSSIFNLGNNTITIKAIDTALGCSAVLDTVLHVFVFNCTLTANAGNNASACDGNTLTITATTTGGNLPLVYQWNSGCTDAACSVSTTGIYYATVVDNYGCTATDSVNITFWQLPNAGITGTAAVCQGTSTTLTSAITGGTTPYTYSWSPGYSVMSTYTVTPLQTTRYRLTVTDSHQCSDTASHQVQVYQKPITSAITGVNSSNQNVQQYYFVTNTAGNTYTWLVTGGTIVNGQGTNAITVYWTTLGVGSVCVTESNPQGCSGTQVCTQVSVGFSCNGFAATAQGHDPTCFGTCNGYINTSITGGTAPYTYTWSDAQHQTGSMAINLCQGSYTVTVKDQYQCTTAATTTLASPTEISIDITISNAHCSANDGAAIATVSGGTPPYTYAWTNGDTLSSAGNLASGMYMLTVTDYANCSKFTLVTINDQDGPSIAVNNVTHLTCYQSLNGSIDITVTGGTTPYIYNWSSGAAMQNIAGLEAGPYDIQVADTNGCTASMTISVEQPSPLAVNVTTTESNCGTSDGTASVSVSGGTPPYQFLWNTGGTAQSPSNMPAGMYYVSVTDSHGCTENSGTMVSISNNGGPQITVDSVLAASCNGNDGAVYISVSGGAGAYLFNWSNTATSEDNTGLAMGNYSVTATDNNGCIGTGMATVAPNVQATPQICMVLVDSTENKNLIVWEKEVTTGIDHYNIYREGSWAGSYFLIGSKNYAELSTFLDGTSHPNNRSYRYRITSVDLCNHESATSIPHKTMFLAINHGIGNGWNLQWSDYEGFNFPGYYIYRYTQSAHWELLDSISIGYNFYTDIPPNQGNLKYLVTVRAPYMCSPTTAKEMGGPFSQSLSNIEDNGIIDVNVYQTSADNLNCNIYPNPVNDNFTINISATQNKLINATAEIVDLQGRIIKTIKLLNAKTVVDFKDFSSGFYSIKIKTDRAVVIKKIVKE